MQCYGQNYTSQLRFATILLAHDLNTPLVYPMVTHAPPISVICLQKLWLVGTVTANKIAVP